MTIAARINGIMARQGETATYKRVTGVSRNDTTMRRTNTYSSTTVKVHLRRFKDRELSGLVTETDRECRIAANALDFVPAPKDIVVVGGEEYKVFAVDRRTANGENALHILQLRKEAD